MQAPNHPTITTNGILRPTQVYVDLERIAENYRRIKAKVGGVTVMPIVKANAYGHGLVEVSRHLVAEGASSLGVAFLEEAVYLRESGLTVPILVLGGVLGDQVPLYIEHDITLTASSVEKLEHIDHVAGVLGKTARVHLKIDTGMERIGVHYYSADNLIETSLKCSHTHIEGIFSHFANADAEDLTSANLQLERFMGVLDFYDKRSIPTPIRHIANSGAILQLPESYLDMVRPGIILFGVYPAHTVKQTIEILPALEWRSRVVYFKVVKPDHPVSYGSTWKTDHLTRVVTVPVGYGDGYFRSMSNKAAVLLNQKRYPVVGRICMDQFMVNIEWDSAYNNDEVVLIGSQGDEVISCEDLAIWAGTIPYEILTNINTRVPRIYRHASH
jgi:alanine racemase